MNILGEERGRRAEQLVALAAAAFAGLLLPDWDQHLHLHRWFLTHSALPLLAVIWLRSPALTAGLALGLAAHFAADLFPQGMRGTALIKLWPGRGVGVAATYAWLAANLAICAAVSDDAAKRLGGEPWRVMLLGAALALAGLYVLLNAESILTLAAMGGGYVVVQGSRVARALLGKLPFPSGEG